MALVEPGRPVSALAELLEELVGDVEVPTIRVPIPNKPGWELECRPVITADHHRRWRKAARNREWKPTDPEALAIDMDVLNALIIAETCVAILKDGKAVRDDVGNDIDFASEWLHKSIGGGRATHVDMVRRFFRNDQHVAEAAAIIAEAAGKPVPTAASSND